VDPQTVVVTGGSRGIGRATALRFAERAGNIVIVHFDPDEAAARETVAMLSERGASAESYKVDLSDFQAVEELFKNILSRYQNIHVLVNNAGITKDTLLMRMRETDWDAVLNVNLKSVFNCTRAVIRPMLKQRQGSIVNISSVVGSIGNAGQSNYAASKAGIMGFTKSVAREAAPRGVTVNAVAPGYVATEMTQGLPDEVKEAFMQQIPLGRVGTPEDVAEAVFWLCSEAAGYITGQVLHVNGGMYM
jgi:3-oxoacyl-[acyl-carrier protein] reductase